MTAKEITPTLPPAHPLAGEQLKKLRQEKSLSLEEVASITRISLSSLRAIESMAYEKLPADPFAKGLIVLYGSFLEIDGRQIADQFFLERDGGKKTSLSPLRKSLINQSLTPKRLAEPAHISSAAVAGILLVCIVVSFSGVCLYFSWNPFAFLTNKTLSLSSSVLNTFHPADPATSKGASQHAFNLQAHFSRDTRILISLDQKEPLEQEYTQGSKAHWEAENQMQIEFFQPDSAELQMNSSPLPFPASTNGRYILRIPAAPTTP